MLPNEATFIFRIAGTVSGNGGIACVNGGPSASIRGAWTLFRRTGSLGLLDNLLFIAHADGTDDQFGAGASSPLSTVNEGKPESLALSIQQNNGSGQRVTTSHKFDGSAWSVIESVTTTAEASMYASTEPLRIGCSAVSTTPSYFNIWNGQIFWIECRTGLNPADTTPPTKGYFTFPATTGNYLSTPDAAALDITGDITIVARVRATDWTPSASTCIVGKWATSNQSYMLALDASGFLRFYTTSDGLTPIITTSSPAVAATSGWKWVAATFDVDNGAGGRDTRFWTSDDGTSWSLIDTFTAGAPTTIFSGSADLQIGDEPTPTIGPWGGDISYVSIRNGIGASGTVGGTEVFRFDGAEGANDTSTSFVARTGQTVTINRAASSPKTVVVPNTGLLWRFDAVEHGVGTVSWTDSQGRIWTIPSSTAILHT